MPFWGTQTDAEVALREVEGDLHLPTVAFVPPTPVTLLPPNFSGSFQ